MDQASGVRSQDFRGQESGRNIDSLIPGRAEGASPESISTDSEYGFRTAAFGGFRNDAQGFSDA
jgi:hypothetical protein